MNKIFLMILCLISWPLQALETNVAPPLSVQPLARIPVQQDGRIKPLEQFARVTLRQLSGSETLDHIDAMPWLMEVLFTPEFASQRPLFLVNNDDLRRALALPDRASHRFSAQELESPMGEQRAQVMPIVMMAPKERSTQQQALMDLYQRYALFIDLQQSFSIVLPLNAPRPESYALPDPLDYLDLQRIRERLLTRAQTLAVQSKGQLKALSSQEQDEVALAMLVEKLEQRALQSQSLRVMPAHWQAAGGEWFAPWALIREGFGSPSSASYLVLWKAAALAYRTGDVAAWNHAASVLADAAAAQLQGWQGVRVQVEYLYVIMAPLNTALALSAAALVMLMLSRRVSLFTAERVQTVLRFALLVLGMALLVRIFILARPPVGTLYESLLFVAWVVLAACTVPKSARQAMLGLGALSTSLLLLLAPVFATDETMGMLSAVLNTDFWLTIHVLCITSGYAACLVVGGLAHAEMLRASRTNMPVMTRTLTRYVLVALALTATGTLLGGVWADQSWGRFWGWDPKENGALLIVLWIIWLLHARASKQLQALGYTVALALLTVIVAIAWFGVNMLGIGLHSYGFTQATAFGLLAFCCMEAMLIAYLALRVRRNIACNP